MTEKKKEITCRGLMFVKQGRIGTRSEGPDYYLQTKDHEYKLARKTEEHVFRPDYYLEFFNRKWVEIDAELQQDELVVKGIHETCAGMMD